MQKKKKIMKHRSQKKRNKKIIVSYYFDKITHRLRLEFFNYYGGEERKRLRKKIYRFPKLITRRNNFNKVSVFFFIKFLSYYKQK